MVSIENNDEINYYLNEIFNSKWSRNYLREQKKTKSYQRLICNQKENSTKPIEKTLKDPIRLADKEVKTEKELENAILDNLDEFMLELGNNYCYKGRQQKMFINNSIYRVDLVFYNLKLKCYVLVDLKIGKIKRSDISQMDMYINYYNKNEKAKSDNKTIGIILTSSKNLDINEYINSDENIYQVKYVTKMPGVDELMSIIKTNRIFLLNR